MKWLSMSRSQLVLIAFFFTSFITFATYNMLQLQIKTTTNYTFGLLISICSDIAVKYRLQSPVGRILTSSSISFVFQFINIDDMIVGDVSSILMNWNTNEMDEVFELNNSYDVRYASML